MAREKVYDEFLESPAGSVSSEGLDTGDPKSISGVPLGGVGTGKIELCPDGGLHHFTINNNNVLPIDGMPGSFLAITAASEGSRATKVLQTSSEIMPDEKLIKPSEISYRGLYPKSIVDYDIGEIPLDVRLTAFSPVIPQAPHALSLPLAYFVFEIENTSEAKVEGSICFSWEDVNGCWGSKVSWDSFVPSTEPHVSEDRGFVERVEISPFATGVSFHHRERHPEVADFAYGDYSLVCESAEPVFLHQYDPGSDIPGLMKQLDSELALEDSLENRPGQTATIVGTSFSLWAGERARVVFALSWYTPDRWGFGKGDIASRVATPYDFAGKKMGQWYANFYSSSTEVLRDNLDLLDDYLDEVDRWQGYILSSTLPSWLKEMLINQNYLLSTNMTWTKDGRVTILESPNCPCLGTIDQRFYGSAMTLVFCPELDHRELMMYADFSDRLYEKLGRYRGQIFHDFGNNRMDFLNNYGYNWIDLNPKFVLLCWRNYLYTGNMDSLKEIYYKAKEAMERERALDRDGDLLPEGYGNCNTFEGHFFGANSYDGGLWLASIRAFREMAEAMGDEETAREYGNLFEKASESFEKSLWDDDRGHYIMCTESRDTRSQEELEKEDQRYLKQNENPDRKRCRDDQLTGTWYSVFLNQGPVNEPERVRTSIETMEDRLGQRLSDDALLISQIESGKTNWPGYNVGHFGSLAISMGYVDLGLASVKGVHDLIYDKWKMIWDQPIGLGPETRPRGDRYMNSGSIWHVLWALQGFHIDIRYGVMGFRPSIPESWRGSFVSPIITGAFWGTASYRESTEGAFEVELEIVLDQDFELNSLLLKTGGRDSLREVEIEGAETPEFTVEFDSNGDLCIRFGEPLRMAAECPVTFRYRLE
jgi:uncharacterized protein (DUF608 family)